MKSRLQHIGIRRILVALCISASIFVSAQKKYSISIPGKQLKELVYKVVNGDTLKMELYSPDNWTSTKKFPAIIFFYGGGWNGGTLDQFRGQAGYFASRGMVTVLADYRVKSRQGTTPYESVKDAKSAVRFLKHNAARLQIDTTKLVASGGSAGGHLAAAVALLPGVNDSIDDIKIDTKVSAVILYNAVVDNGPGEGGFQHERMGKSWLTISPIHHIEKGAPPTLLFLGDQDKIIPVSVAHEYKSKMEAVFSRCDVIIYKGQGHGFFNPRVKSNEYYLKTTREADKFLSSLGYIKGEPTIE
ncbi:alpha/beta hydrolase [Maribacter forsetii]|uniref:alpha/beta hydrolase n=1 Tax=Maribacter forsetii TaxID=444515 RepID=UPI00056794DD|nr:alpha/beta hydrolase [Maribacter forsetii]